MVRFQCENEGCRLYHKEYEYGSDEANPGRCLSCRLPMAKFLSADMHDGTDNPFWGKGIAEVIAEAGTILDEQEIPLTGRALFVPGYGVFEQEEDPESVKLLEEDDQEYEELIIFDPDLHQVKCDPTDRVAGLMRDNNQINKAFLFIMNRASAHKAFFIESRLREMHRELLNIINIEEGD